MKVSIVIPVYNEAERLGACLAAIARQTMTPHEIIVVDNNSTDSTAAVASSYPFVTLLHEPRQGVVHARTRGFNAARGDIIGRIDADTVLPTEWTAQVVSIFNDQSLSAVSGAPHYYDLALSKVADAIDCRLRARLACKLGDQNFLWGANMAIRRSAWRQTYPLLCTKNNMHEDFDLGIHLQLTGHTVLYDESLVANVSSRRIDSGFWAYVRYTMMSPRTYALHRLHRRRGHWYPVLLVCWLCYMPGRFLYRAYDPTTASFSLDQLLATSSARVDPTTNVA